MLDSNIANAGTRATASASACTDARCTQCTQVKACASNVTAV